MDTLRNYFIVDELQRAAIEQNEQKLLVVREIIRRIKLLQLEAQELADDTMVKQALQELYSDLQAQTKMVAQYLEESNGG